MSPKILCWGTAWILIPLTVAPTPIAAPRRVAISVLGASAISMSCFNVSTAFSLFCFINGGITFTMASCTDFAELGSSKRCKSLGNISGTLACSGPKCLDKAPKNTATPKRSDSPAAAPGPLSSKSSTAPNKTSANSSPCFSIKEVPAANNTSRSSTASGVLLFVRTKAWRKRKRNALTTSCSPCKLPAKTRSKHLAMQILELASPKNRWVSASKADFENAGSSSSTNTSATALAINICTSVVRPVFVPARSMSSINNSLSASRPKACKVSFASSAELGSNAPKRNTARAARTSKLPSSKNGLCTTCAKAAMTAPRTTDSSA
mmetsp:Transcript_49244/g.141557  ORF Transcript_49244/g.141557 Transcript_49244/m.141557 type:complete len:322 (-) Transcript_49244:1843-2808(-)